MKTSLILASTFLFGAESACNGNNCTAQTNTTAFFQRDCTQLTEDVCVDCPDGSYGNYFASDFNATASPPVVCSTQAGCADKFNSVYLPWPQWLALLDEEKAPNFTKAYANYSVTPTAVPSFLALVYGIYGGQYKTANLTDPAQREGLLKMMQVNETEDVYVTLYGNEASDCGLDAKPNCQAYGGLPHINGYKMAVSECTKLVYTDAKGSQTPMTMRFKQGTSVLDNGDGTVTCEYGFDLGKHDCTWSDNQAVVLKTDADGNTPCGDFPLGQGFQLKVSCHLAGGTKKKFRGPESSLLDLALHDATCRETGRIEFPCSWPKFCADVAFDPSNQALVNATIKCEDLWVAANRDHGKVAECLAAYPGVSGTKYHTDCISKMAGASGASGASSLTLGVVAAALAMIL